MSPANSLPGADENSVVDEGRQETKDADVPTAPADPTDPPVDPEEPINPA